MLKLLCSGDIHIGRRPTRLPERWEHPRLSAATGWADLVQLALRERVDALLLSGDVVDRDNRYFEAFGPLESGIRELARAGIRVVAVAGNHDFDVLPQLAERFGDEAFTLLGVGGRWERLTIEQSGTAVLHVDGWSFPAEHYDQDPLASYTLGREPDAPVVGLLHADLDQAASRYAPVAAAELRRRPPALWLLGHIHAPALQEAPGLTPILYPGSPLPLSPRETGAHGPWIAAVEPGGALRLEHRPSARVRYEEFVVSVDGAADEAEVRRRFADGVQARLAAVVSAVGGALQLMSCRVRLVGRTPLHRRLNELVGEAARELEVPYGQAFAVVERTAIATRPARDLEAISRGNGPPAVLARTLLALRAGDAQAAELFAGAREALVALSASPHYRELGSAPADSGIDDAVLARRIEQQGLLLLDALLAQKDPAP